MTFREFADAAINEAWQAKRQDVIQLWKGLPPNQPLKITPIPPQHAGPRYGEDGLRITGSAAFIASVMSRIKDLVNYESVDGLRLDVEYRQIAAQGTVVGGPRFACYIHVIKTT